MHSMLNTQKTLRRVPGTRSGLNNKSHSSGAETSLGPGFLLPYSVVYPLSPSPSITGYKGYREIKQPADTEKRIRSYLYISAPS